MFMNLAMYICLMIPFIIYLVDLPFTTTSTQNAETANNHVPTGNSFHKTAIRATGAHIKNMQMDKARKWRR